MPMDLENLASAWVLYGKLKFNDVYQFILNLFIRRSPITKPGSHGPHDPQPGYRQLAQ